MKLINRALHKASASDTSSSEINSFNIVKEDAFLGEKINWKEF